MTGDGMGWADRERSWPVALRQQSASTSLPLHFILDYKNQERYQSCTGQSFTDCLPASVPSRHPRASPIPITVLRLGSGKHHVSIISAKSADDSVCHEFAAVAGIRAIGADATAHDHRDDAARPANSHDNKSTICVADTPSGHARACAIGATRSSGPTRYFCWSVQPSLCHRYPRRRDRRWP